MGAVSASATRKYRVLFPAVPADADGALERAELRAGWRRAGWYPDLTIGEALAQGARTHPDDQVVFAPAGGAASTSTLGEIAERSHRVASALAATGLLPGDAVVVQAPADAASTDVMVALWHLGTVVVPLAATATTAELAHAVRETGARTAVVALTWRGRDLASDIAAADVGLRRVIVIGDDGPPGTIPLVTLDGSAAAPAGRHDPTAMACVLYTSGSTAAPKGVRHSHETLLCGLTAVPAERTTRMLATFPAGHVAAILALLRPLTSGGTTVVMDRWSARAAAQLIEEHRLTTSAGTPFFLATLLDEAERSGRDISSLNRFLVGAAAVPPALVERAEAAGIVSWRTYGSTEQPAISAGSPMDPPEKRRLTDGRVAPGNDVRLIDASGEDVSLLEEGEILARGPKQFLGYQDPQADADAFVGTWFRTGDLGRLDADGYLVVTDRVKDVIIRGGENISSREVEEVLSRHPAIKDVAVCAAPDDVWGEAVCAFVVSQGPSPSLEDLRDHGRDQGLAPHKLPTRMTLVDTLPRTPAGKVRKRDLIQSLA
jgi:cyclohexanecarboxylate-CoA ligase